MNQIIKLSLGKVVTTLVVVAMILALTFAFAAPTAQALTEDQITSILGLLSSFGADQTTIDNVNASLRGQAAPGGGSTPSSSSVCPYTWTTSRTTGSSGDDVLKLQQFLNSDSATMVASSGVGSAGNETNYFGSLTAAAVSKFQNKYASQVLTPVGLTSGTGYFGASTRAHMNSLCTTVSEGETPTPSVGTGLGVSNTTQPLATLAPNSASRVPFTKFVVTAGNDGDVVMNSVTVQRGGLGVNAVFAGLVLLDENGTQYGLSKTLNSNNQARVGADVTIPRGTSKTFTIAGNMASDLTNYAGQVVSLSVVGINTSATVSGSLPISGAAHTINASLSIGTVTATRGSLDPNTNPTKEVGTTGYTFAAVKFTAGSAEDVVLKSVRWNQTSSVSSDDIANMKIVLDGVEYMPTVSADGKYYSATFGSGVVIKEGLSKEISIKGDIVGGSNRGVDFDLYQDTDAYFVGQTFGYGVTPTIGGNNDADGSGVVSGTNIDDSEFNDGTSDGGTPPWYDGREVTVGTGSLTVSSTNDVPAGNIADGANNVSLGSFKFDVKGEEVSFTQIALTIATDTSGSDELLTNITLVDGNGSILAGPQDPNAVGDTVTFTDTVTFPVGVHTVIVKGTLDNDWDADDTIAFSFNPSSAISTLRGAISGQTLTAIPAATVTAKTQTVSAAALTVTPASSFVSKNVINNSNDVVVARYVLDGTASGEDLRITTVKIVGTTGANADIDDYNTIQLFDGSTALNTGSNISNPSGNDDNADVTLTITLDSPGLTIPKGTTKVIELRANINDAAVGSTPEIRFDFQGLSNGDWTTTGLSTGTDVTETLSGTDAATLTVVAGGTLTESVATADPTEKWYVSGSTGTVGIFQFTATNEDQAVTDLSFGLDTSSSTSADIAEVSIWDMSAPSGQQLLQTKISPFVTSNIEAFDLPAAGTGSFIVPAHSDKNLTVKVKFADVGVSLAGSSGNWVILATTTVAANHKTLGKESGTSSNILGDSGSTTGAKYFKSLPTVAKLSVPTNVLANGTQELYRFSVSADPAGKIGIYKFSFTVATTGANADTYSLVEMGSGKTVKSSMDTVDGQLTVIVNNGTYGATLITIPADQTYTYQLKAVVANAGDDNDSVRIYLNDDTGVLATSGTTTMEKAASAASDSNGNFVWSPISTTTATITTSDWMNGYKVPGMESDNIGIEVVSN